MKILKILKKSENPISKFQEFSTSMKSFSKKKKVFFIFFIFQLGLSQYFHFRYFLGPADHSPKNGNRKSSVTPPSALSQNHRLHIITLSIYNVFQNFWKCWVYITLYILSDHCNINRKRIWNFKILKKYFLRKKLH